MTVSHWSKKIFSRRMLTIAFLGLASGVPLGVMMTILQAWLTEKGIDLKTIGLVSLVQIPYTFKFCWSPLMDRFSLPILGRRRGWMLLAQILMSASIMSLGYFDPHTQTLQILAIAVLIAFFSASHDIVIDAFRRDILPQDELGFGSAVATNSYLIGFRFLASVLGLTLADQFEWTTVFNVLGGFCLVGMIGTLIAQEDSHAPSLAPKSIKDAVVLPFLEFLKRPGAWEILLFILLYKIGDNLATNMALPFYLQQGFSKTEVAIIGKMVGFWAMFFGGFVGGSILLKYNIKQCLFWFGVFQGLSTLAFMSIVHFGHNSVVLGMVVGLENFTIGMGTSALATFLLGLCNKKFSATQYALLTSFMGIPRAVIPAMGGYLVEFFGWSGFFIFCSLIAIPALVMVYLKVDQWVTE